MGELKLREDQGSFIVEGARCRECGLPLELASEEPPGDIALGFAVGMVCDSCDEHLTAADERRRAEADFNRRIRSSGLPEGLRDISWDDFDLSGPRGRAHEAARHWAGPKPQHRGRRLFLSGPTGTGKTRLAAIASWTALRHRAVTFMSIPILLQAAFADPRSPERRRAQEALMGFGALVLDDLGKERPSDWTRQVLFGAIDSRVQAGSPILITSNHDADELAERLGSAFGSRLAEFRQFTLEGKDRRVED